MPLKGRAIEIPDLRAGFAYLIAAMVAEGVSEVSGIRYVERGYAAVPEKLRGLGVSLEVETLPKSAVASPARTVPAGEATSEAIVPPLKTGTVRKPHSKRKPEPALAVPK
jgi:UDP-N-acetylglucosamine 1-carboxyvinyltransferase